MEPPPSGDRSVPAPLLRVLLDEGVPASVGTVFKEHGFQIIPFEDVVLRGSRDELVCAAAEANNALLVAFDNDMKQLARQHGITPARFKRLSLLKFECEEPNADERLRAAMSLLEHEWGIRNRTGCDRIHVVIGKMVMRTHR